MIVVFISYSYEFIIILAIVIEIAAVKYIQTNKLLLSLLTIFIDGLVLI